MIEDIAGVMVDRLLHNEVIEEEDLEIYLYGIIDILRYVINLVPTIIIGIILGELRQGILFTVAFAALRTYAGGYHTKTPGRCFILSMGVFTTVLLTMKYVIINNFICWELLIISGVVILSLSPVEAINKSIDEMERKLYRKKSIIIWCVETIVGIALMFAQQRDIALCIILAQVAVSGSLIAGEISLKVWMNEEI